ncbi:MAG: 50S ribosomal protein L3 [Candidatus Eisenbacteria bacterium]
MTQLFSEKGRHSCDRPRGWTVPGAAGQVGDDGYAAAQLGFETVAELAAPKPERGHLVRHGSGALKHLREFRLEAGAAELKTGDTLDVTQFEVGARVDVVSTSKGHGFQGVVKRHHFTAAARPTAARPMTCRARSAPAPGPRTSGRASASGTDGNKRITAQNLEVVKIDQDRNLLLVRGAVPGGSNTLVVITPSYKSLKERKKGSK